MAINRYFTVTVVGHRMTKSIWRIDGSLAFKEGVDPATHEGLIDRARLSLVNAIVREGVRGRSFGATSIQVHMEVDGRASDFELADRSTRVATPS